MLKKNKNCIEFSMHAMMLTHKPYQEGTEIDITGVIPGREILTEPNPFDIPCDVVMVPKKEFERLQANFDFNAELAKQWEENYNLLLKKTGFDTVESLVFYLTNVGQSNTLLEALASLRDRAKYTCDEWKDLNRKLQECEKDYISERDKAEALEKENEELKKKLHEPDPFAECKELSKNLYSVKDAEELEWVLNHVCGGHASVNGWMVTAKLWRRNYETLSKIVGFSSVEEIQDYLTNEAEADTLHEAISKLHDQVKYTCEEWYSANSSNNSWKVAAECNSPKELIEKREAIEKEIEVYSRTLNKWKEGTGCPSPSAAKTLIESGASWHHAYNQVIDKNRKLTEEIDSWKNVTGYSTPEDYLHAKINDATPFDYTAAWQKFTGCDSPEEAKIKINDLKEKTHEWAIDYEALLKLTGYKSEHDIRVLLNGDKYQYRTMRDLVETLQRKVKFTESNWQKATGCDTYGRAEEKLEYYKSRLGNAVQAASIASKHLDNITF